MPQTAEAIDEEIKKVKNKIENVEKDLLASNISAEKRKRLEEKESLLRKEKIQLLDLQILLLSQDAPAQKKLKANELVEFNPSDKKKRLPLDKIAEKVGGLLDRHSSIEQLFCALEKLVKVMGSSLDKKDVPIIAVCGKSETGKTEFLRWVFNNCCTFLPDADKAGSLVGRLNLARPDSAPPLQNLLVLFASFNQASTYMKGEGNVVETTTERLLRSFHGNVEFGHLRKTRYEGCHTWSDITKMFSNGDGRTGFIFLLDELSKVKDKDYSAYQELLDSILGFSQVCLQDGTFCAVVGSSLSVHDLGNTVVARSGRPLEPVYFPKEMPRMEERTREILINETAIFAGFEGNREDREFAMSVAMKVAQSSSSVRIWEQYLFGSPSRSTVSPPEVYCKMPTMIDANAVFLWISRTVLGREEMEYVTEETEKAVDILSGNLVLETNPRGRVSDWNSRRGTVSVPGWRLLQFGVKPGDPPLFQLVQNWVLVEVRNMLYLYGKDSATTTWEMTTMALLELRKAMVQAVNKTTPSIGDTIQGIRVHHNLSATLLDMKASPQPVGSDKRSLPYPHERITEPTIFLSNIPNEKAVEGLVRACFHDVTIFFQMKLYSRACASEILTWLNKAHERARKLGYEEGKRIVQLFVTGVIDDNVRDRIHEWPVNSMVFSDNALIDLFKPFGDGYIQEIVERNKRD